MDKRGSGNMKFCLVDKTGGTRITIIKFKTTLKSNPHLASFDKHLIILCDIFLKKQPILLFYATQEAQIQFYLPLGKYMRR